MTHHLLRLCNALPNAFARLAVAAWLLLPAGSRTLGADESADRVEAVDVAGREYHGVLRGWREGVVTIAESATDASAGAVELPEDDLVMLRFASAQNLRDVGYARGARRSPTILLENGDRLMLRPLALVDERLVAEPTARSALPAMRIPFETVRAAVLDPPAGGSAEDALLVQLAERREDDAIRLKNGKLVTGELVTFGDRRFAVRSAVGELEIAADGVRSIAMNSELISFPVTEGLTQLLTLSDGSWLTVRDVQLVESGRLRVDAAFGGVVDLSLAEVRAIRFLGGRVTAVSDLEPAEYRHTPYLSAGWPLVRDASVSRRPLRLRGVEYPRGLGMHSASRVRYSLDGAYERFTATIGIDDGAPRGAAVFAVEVDGERVFESPVLTGAMPAVAVGPVDVKGARNMVLVVEYGTGADVQDHTNWCDPILIRTKAAQK